MAKRALHFFANMSFKPSKDLYKRDKRTKMKFLVSVIVSNPQRISTNHREHSRAPYTWDEVSNPQRISTNQVPLLKFQGGGQSFKPSKDLYKLLYVRTPNLSLNASFKPSKDLYKLPMMKLPSIWLC
ncbi:MAG: hypothetical protein MjAS7_1983 [Metallosphaera javensis (ex Sakai et al. 2022)]|nr:MAG: hypothetical protein MjAS7_1983 [Metallosphaera javensis (ex Sakai et al. 2022)]